MSKKLINAKDKIIHRKRIECRDEHIGSKFRNLKDSFDAVVKLNSNDNESEDINDILKIDSESDTSEFRFYSVSFSFIFFILLGDESY